VYKCNIIAGAQEYIKNPMHVITMPSIGWFR